MAHEVTARGVVLPLHLKAYLELMKLRIGSMIALCAVMGYVAIAPHILAEDILLLILATLCASASASVFNHVWESDIDGLMLRTRQRPMVTGVIADRRYPMAMAALLLLAGLGIAAAAFNAMAALHLFLGAFFYGVVYTVWLKRLSWINIVIGGAAGSFAVLAGAAAIDPLQWQLPLMLALLLWTPSHFWALAILLKDDYARAGIPMLPVLVGDAATARAIGFNSLLLVGSAALPWMLGFLGPAYAVLSCLLGAWLLWGNWRLIQTPDHPRARKCFFASIQYLAGLFLAVLLDVNWPV
ncbi:Protoheme IX farnesyltransferase 1 [Rhodospirillaceae bacterium LM-1]|nr:Protoheme IX farnesyltransferase 1 [Rhodospirillaceae bacterium LM-1]